VDNFVGKAFKLKVIHTKYFIYVLKINKLMFGLTIENAKLGLVKASRFLPISFASKRSLR